MCQQKSYDTKTKQYKILTKRCDKMKEEKKEPICFCGFFFCNKGTFLTIQLSVLFFFFFYKIVLLKLLCDSKLQRDEHPWVQGIMEVQSLHYTRDYLRQWCCFGWCEAGSQCSQCITINFCSSLLIYQSIQSSSLFMDVECTNNTNNFFFIKHANALT